MMLVDTLMKSLKPNSVGGSPEFNNYIDSILENLTLKIGDSKSATKTLAEDAFYFFTDFRDVGVQKVAETLLRSNGVPKSINDNKRKKARLDMLARMAEDYGIDGPNIPLARTVDFAKKELENPAQEVRESAHNLILHFMKALGLERIEPMLDGKFFILLR